MALPTSYLTTTRNLKGILTAIQNAKAPEAFTVRFLNSLDYKASADRLIIGVLKSLGFLDEAGKPTDRYFAFLDQTQAPAILAEGIRDAYADLFQVNLKANEMTRNEFINKLKTLSQGQLTDSVLDKMALTFQALCSIADFSSTAKVKMEETKPEEELEERELPADPKQNVPLNLGGLVYNIQIVLPETKEQAVYDALFRALRSHLL